MCEIATRGWSFGRGNGSAVVAVVIVIAVGWILVVVVVVVTVVELVGNLSKRRQRRHSFQHIFHLLEVIGNGGLSCKHRACELVC